MLLERAQVGRASSTSPTPDASSTSGTEIDANASNIEQVGDLDKPEEPIPTEKASVAPVQPSDEQVVAEDTTIPSEDSTQKDIPAKIIGSQTLETVNEAVTNTENHIDNGSKETNGPICDEENEEDRDKDKENEDDKVSWKLPQLF